MRSRSEYILSVASQGLLGGGIFGALQPGIPMTTMEAMKNAPDRPSAFRPKRLLRFEVFEAIVGRPAYDHSHWVKWRGSEAETFERYHGASVDLSVRLRRGRFPFGSCAGWDFSDSLSVEQASESFEARGLISSVRAPSRRFVLGCLRCGGSGSSCRSCVINRWARDSFGKKRGTGYGEGSELPRSINDLAHWTAFGEKAITSAEGLAEEIGRRLLRFHDRQCGRVTVSWIGAERHRWRPTHWQSPNPMPDIFPGWVRGELQFRPVVDVTPMAARQFDFATDYIDAKSIGILAPLSELHDLGFALHDAQMSRGEKKGVRNVNIVIAFPVTT